MPVRAPEPQVIARDGPIDLRPPAFAHERMQAVIHATALAPVILTARVGCQCAFRR